MFNTFEARTDLTVKHEVVIVPIKPTVSIYSFDFPTTNSWFYQNTTHNSFRIFTVDLANDPVLVGF